MVHDILIIGDSMIELLQPHVKSFADVEAFPGYTSQSISTNFYVKRIIPAYSKIIVVFGTNDPHPFDTRQSIHYLLNTFDKEFYFVHIPKQDKSLFLEDIKANFIWCNLNNEIYYKKDDPVHLNQIGLQNMAKVLKMKLV